VDVVSPIAEDALCPVDKTEGRLGGDNPLESLRVCLRGHLGALIP